MFYRNRALWLLSFMISALVLILLDIFVIHIPTAYMIWICFVWTIMTMIYDIMQEIKNNNNNNDRHRYS